MDLYIIDDGRSKLKILETSSFQPNNFIFITLLINR